MAFSSLYRITTIVGMAALAATGPASRAAEGKGRSAFATQDKSQLNHAVFRAIDGAPSSINAIARDIDGYLWIASVKGLTRFDGVRFDQPFSGALRDPALAVFADRNGDLWVSLLSGGLVHIHAGHVSVDRPAALGTGLIFDIRRLDDGTLWAVASTGVARFTNGRWDVPAASMGYRPDRPTGSAGDTSELWIFDAGHAYVLRSGGRSFEEAAAGAFERKSAGDLPTSMPAPAFGTTGAVDGGGASWVVGSRGMDRYRWQQPAPPVVEHIGPQDGLASDHVVGVEYDAPDDIIWVWTDASLERFRPNRVTRVPLPADMSRIAISSSSRDGAWVGAGLGYLIHATSPSSVERLQGRERTYALFGARDGTTWLADRQGITHLSHGDVERISYPTVADKVTPLTAQAIAVDASGAIWLSTPRHGFFRFDHGRWGSPAWPGGAPATLANDASGRVWAGYADNLVRVQDGAGYRSFGAGDGIQVGNVLAVVPGPTRTWISGARGVQFERGGRFYALQPTGDQTFDGASGLALAPDGTLWINTIDGIARLSAQDVDRAVGDANHRVSPLWFNSADGIEGAPEQLQSVPTLSLSQDGTVWATTEAGLFAITPAMAGAISDPRRSIPAVQRVIADGQELDTSAEVTVPALSHSLEIDYTAPELRMPERLRFAYRLEGTGEDWQGAGAHRSAFYTNLPPGAYRFWLSVANADGQWGLPVAGPTLRVLPAWYQTWYVRSAAVAGVLLLVFTFMRTRARRLAAARQARAVERERIARELHDTLLQGMQGLIYHVDSALKQARDPSLRILLIDAVERAQDSLVEARERVGSLREEEGAPVDLDTMLKEAARTILHGHNVTFALHAEGTHRLLLPAVTNELMTACQEALLNALTHGHPRAIRVTLSYGRRELAVVLEDDGTGIDEKVVEAGHRSGHWGLPGMRERVALFAGRVDIAQRPGGGTVVTIRIPARRVYAMMRP